MAYYKIIDGKKYDAELIELAEKLTSGNGDGRLSKADAEQLLEAVKDGDWWERRVLDLAVIHNWKCFCRGK